MTDRTLPASPRGHFIFLDGMRGWASVFVLIFHIFCDGFPPTPWAETELRKFLPFSGFIAIGGFFLISGFALSAKFIATGDRRVLARMAVSRYPRLALPILAVCAAVHVLFVLHALDPNRPPPFNMFYNFEPTLTHLLRFSLFEVFAAYSPTRSYMGQLWTIPIEALGSVLVLSLLFVVGRRSWRWAAYALLAAPLLYLGSFQALFVLGVAWADMHAMRWHERLPNVLFLAIFLIGCAIPFLVPMSMLAVSLSGVVAVCVGAAGYKPLHRLLSGRLSALFGRLSFPLYLAHGAVLVIVGIPLMGATGHNQLLMLAAGIVLIGLSFLAALAVVPVNEAAIRLARRIGDAVVREAGHRWWRKAGRVDAEQSPDGSVLREIGAPAPSKGSTAEVRPAG